ncbi:PEP-CTERM sorting domain-containing protein [Nitrosovibrio tenuis]|uniref:PEP-CTERM sorting domain-containing protein n=1 Tax=Nitrosovibrio tenuis TaxID=1233 RepID=UPI00115F7DAD
MKSGRKPEQGTGQGTAISSITAEAEAETCPLGISELGGGSISNCLPGQTIDGCTGIGNFETTLTNGQFRLNKVSEPGTLALFGITMVGFGFAQRRNAMSGQKLGQAPFLSARLNVVNQPRTLYRNSLFIRCQGRRRTPERYILIAGWFQSALLVGQVPRLHWIDPLRDRVSRGCPSLILR